MFSHALAVSGFTWIVTDLSEQNAVRGCALLDWVRCYIALVVIDLS